MLTLSEKICWQKNNINKNRTSWWNDTSRRKHLSKYPQKIKFSFCKNDGDDEIMFTENKIKEDC